MIICMPLLNGQLCALVGIVNAGFCGTSRSLACFATRTVVHFCGSILFPGHCRTFSHSCAVVPRVGERAEIRSACGDRWISLLLPLPRARSRRRTRRKCEWTGSRGENVQKPVTSRIWSEHTSPESFQTLPQVMASGDSPLWGVFVAFSERAVLILVNILVGPYTCKHFYPFSRTVH